MRPTLLLSLPLGLIALGAVALGGACDPQRPVAAASVGGATAGAPAAVPVGPVSHLGEYYTVAGEMMAV